MWQPHTFRATEDVRNDAQPQISNLTTERNSPVTTNDNLTAADADYLNQIQTLNNTIRDLRVHNELLTAVN